MAQIFAEASARMDADDRAEQDARDPFLYLGIPARPRLLNRLLGRG